MTDKVVRRIRKKNEKRKRVENEKDKEEMSGWVGNKNFVRNGV